MKNEKWVPCFDDLTGKMYFLGAYVFSYNNKNLLLGKNGNILIVDDELYAQFDKKVLDEEIWFKLLQRGLAIHREREERVDIEDRNLPSFFMIDITNNCNIGCKYCLRESSDSINSKVLSDEMAISIVDYIANYCKKYNLFCSG